jgi:hypothetical protein
MLPAGMAFSVIGTEVVLSGTPTIFAEPDFVANATINSALVSASLKYVITMNPCLEILTDQNYNVYSNVPTSIGLSIRGYPLACNLFNVSIATTLPNITINQSGLITGRITQAGTAVVNVSGFNTLSNRANIQFSLIPDVVTIVPINPGNTIQKNDSFSLNCSATSRSQQPLTYYTIPEFDGPIGISINRNTGFITGIPRGVSPIPNYTVYASTPQGVLGSTLFRIAFIPDLLTFTAGYGLSNYCYPSDKYLPLIQGREIRQSEYPNDTLGFQSTTRSGDAGIVYIGSNFPAGVTMTLPGTIVGTPSTSGRTTCSVIAASRNGIRGSISLQFDIAPDMLIVTSPLSLDFVGTVGSTMTYSILGYALSQSKIVSYGITGGAGRVSISPGGQLTVVTTTSTQLVSFTITATTLFGTVLTKSATVTVNNSTVGRFISPTGSGLLLLPFGTTYPIQTSPNGFSFTIVGSTDIGTSGSNLTRLTNTAIYPPQIISISAGAQLSIPVRVATNSITPSVVGNPGINRWIQYVPITLTLSATQPSASKVVFAVPNPPNGVLWNPINSTLTRAPNQLTIQDQFTAYASDGFTTAPITIQYSVGAPMYLRLFSAPSAYTNYVKQSAFIKAAVHAIDNTVFLPDALITTQTGPYPVDDVKELVCYGRPAPRAPFVDTEIDFVGLTTTGIGYSFDGINWSNGIGYENTDFAWNGRIWVSYSSGMSIGLLYYSMDGITWTESPSNAGNPYFEYYNVVWNGAIWVAAVFGTTLALYSVDGIRWTPGVFPQGKGDVYVNGGYSCCWTGSQWLLASDVNGTTIYYSTDGITWYPRSSPSLGGYVTGLISTGKECVGTGRGLTGLYSPDGITWTTLAISGNIVCAEAGNGLFVIGLNITQTSTGGLYYSMGGNTWTRVNNTINEAFYMVRYNGNRWVALGEKNIWYSTNGKDWSKVYTFGGDYVNTLSYYKNSWLARDLYSPDGLTWTVIPALIHTNARNYGTGGRELQRPGAAVFR